MAKGLTLAAIKSNVRTVALDLREYGFDGVEEPLEVTYRTNFWTVGAQTEYLKDGVTWGDSVMKIIRDSVISWNLTDDGKPVEITDEFLRDSLGFPVLRGIVDAMIEGVAPNPTTSLS